LADGGQGQQLHRGDGALPPPAMKADFQHIDVLVSG
jgi:hypothetical protein